MSFVKNKFFWFFIVLFIIGTSIYLYDRLWLAPRQFKGYCAVKAEEQGRNALRYLDSKEKETGLYVFDGKLPKKSVDKVKRNQRIWFDDCLKGKPFDNDYLKHMK